MTPPPRPVPEIMTEARDRMVAGEARRAGELYRQVVQRHPDHAGAWLGRIEAALAAREPERALRLLDRAGKRCPGQADQLQRKRVRALDMSGRTAEALETALPLQAAAPQDAPLAVLVAGLTFRTGDPAGAEARHAAVLETHPDHPAAWLGRIEAVLAQDDPARALDLLDAAEARCPGQAGQLRRRRVRALDRLGRLDEAIALAAPLQAAAPGDTALTMQLAGLLARRGDAAEAEALYAAILDTAPDHAGAWLGRIETALKRGAPARALDLLDMAEARCPGHGGQLRLKRIRALELLGRLAGAVDVATALHEDAPGDPAPAMLLARLLRQGGDLDGAEARYRALLDADPGHAGAWLGLAETAQARGDPDRALALVAEGLAAAPGDAALIARQAGLMLQMEQPEAAVALLTEALAGTPDAPRLRMDLARAQLQAGRADAAEGLFAALLGADPGNEPARLGLAEAQAARGAPETGLATLAEHAGDSPALTLRTVELMAQAGQGERAPLLDRLAEAAPGLSETDLIRLFRLGEQADHVGSVVAAVAAVGARETLSPLIARFLMTRARLILPPEAARGLQAALERRLPEVHLADFRAFATALLSGPEEALAQVRAALPPRRDTQGAGVLGERLLDAGRGPAAHRYLRACVRRWPGALRLRRLYLRAAVDTGRLAEGHDWLDDLSARFPGLDLDIDRMQLMIHEGRTAETREMAEARARAGLRTLQPRQMLDVALALGDLEAATDLVARVRNEPGAGRQSAAHFSTTLQGAQFNELRLYRAAEVQARAAGEDPDAFRARMARDFFFPAAEIVARHAGGLGARPGEITVPRRIFQYWNRPQVPVEVFELMKSWQAAEGFDYHLLDRRAGLSFLREHFGPRHARAFQLANSPAEECDFLRLCLLYRHGGIYADADDRLTGDADALIAEGPGLILGHELWGAVANNVICAPPVHPLLGWALDTAGRSLLARENDGTWFKSGPGLMTRAVAAWLGQADDDEIRAGLTIVPLPRLRAHVQMHVRLGYKTSGQYWNARDRHAPGPLIEALTALR